MKNLILAVGSFAAAFAVTTACKRRKHSRIMTVCELYEDNDVELEELLND